MTKIICEICGHVTKFWQHDRLSYGIRPVCLDCIKGQRKKPGKRRRNRRESPGQLFYTQLYFNFENSVPGVTSAQN
jgi:hypothetical protein